jgi:hypothetical protein
MFYEVELQRPGGSEFRVTDTPLDVGDEVEIGSSWWLVDRVDAPVAELRASARFVCVEARERSVRLRQRSTSNHMPAEPSEQDLLAFVEAMLTNLDRERREPAVVAQAVSENRAQWVMLYNASLAFADPTESTPLELVSE